MAALVAQMAGLDGCTEGHMKARRRPLDAASISSSGASSRKRRIGSLCTGYGGLDAAAIDVLDGEVVWCADSDPYVATLLKHRYPGVPNLGDITAVDWSRVAEVDALVAGFPCQDTSNAGFRIGLKEGNRSGLWLTIADAIRVLRPPLVFVENVPPLRVRGLDRVQTDLAALGYDTAWMCVRASDVGAAHNRDRMFILGLRGRQA
ncbi:DNA cytosine methyltransferase [Fodinicola acaciae]|uniref:DNA cytosine methyltransferase n=1 Tax=Fodinicola acaciae TaxID=2681555 RepID=UPI001C9E8DCE|nr:DNA cytosine methyltransferase [Fodinicola acaciae]